MSENLFHLVCQNHTPEIFSEGFHFDHLTEVRLDLMNRDKLAHFWNSLGDPEHYVRSTVAQTTVFRFLGLHQKCSIRIQDDYGRVYPTEPIRGKEEQPSSVRTDLGEIEYIQSIDQGLIVRFSTITPEGERMLRLMRGDI